MKKNLLSELNRSREIMGLPTLSESHHIAPTPTHSISEVNRILEIMELPILTEQESKAVLGYEDYKECKCNDGTSAPECCSEEEGGYGPGYTDTVVKQYDSPLHQSYGLMGQKRTEITKDMYLEEILKKESELLANFEADYAAWKALSKEEQKKESKKYCVAKCTKQGSKKWNSCMATCDLSYQWISSRSNLYYSIKSTIQKMEKIVSMSAEEFLTLDPSQRSMYARTPEERVQATKDYNVIKQKGDLDWDKKRKRWREELSLKMAEGSKKEFKRLTKLMEVFYDKLDRKSRKRWNNEDKEYNEQDPPWEMTEEDKIQLFTIFKNYLESWRRDNIKLFKKSDKSYRKVAKKYFSKINLKNVKGPDEKIEEEGEETPDEQSCPAPIVRLPFEIFGIEEDDWKPFANNSSALSPDLTEDIDKVISTAGKFKEENPEFTYKVVEYKIWASASRAKNGGAVKSWSFKQLSESRAKSVETYVNSKLSEIGVASITPVIDAGGTNGDGSSGPNPPPPFSMRLEGGPKADTNEANRNKYGEVDTSCKNVYGGKFLCPSYDKFKYVGLELVIQGVSPEVEQEEPEDVAGKEEPPVVELIPSRKWEISFIPKKKYTKKYKKKLVWPKIRWSGMKRFYWKPENKSKWGSTECADFMRKNMEINFWLPTGIKVGPVIQDAINNGMASYGDFTFTTKE